MQNAHEQLIDTGDAKLAKMQKVVDAARDLRKIQTFQSGSVALSYDIAKRIEAEECIDKALAELDKPKV